MELDRAGDRVTISTGQSAAKDPKMRTGPSMRGPRVLIQHQRTVMRSRSDDA